MFNIFKKKQKNISDPYAILEGAIELLPEFYRTEPGFSACLRSAANHDSKAVASLIALTTVEGHYFSDDFWKEVSESARLLALPEQVSYCKKQISKNAQELKDKTPRGWTTVKVGTSGYKHYIAQSIKDSWNEERRRKHNVPKLLQENGFHLVKDGRVGTIYYVKDGQLIEIDLEMAGSREYDIIIFFGAVTHYALPKKISLTEDEKNQLKIELVGWLSEKGIKAHLG
jgi:hypothetical protein